VQRPLLLRAVLAAAAALASVYFAKLGLFALVGTFIAWASLPRGKGSELKRERLLLTLAGVASCIGFLRFLVLEAMPGIVAGGNRATEARAISRLREISFAEDAARRWAKHDPDRDGIGSALLIGELSGELPVRAGQRLQPPLLEGYPKLVETALGPACEIGGYYLLVCVPQPGGGFTARPAESMDEELAERRLIAYAWPSGTGPGLTNAIALDEREHIWLAPAGPGKRFGPDAPPACDDVLSEATRDAWKPWQDKQPRRTLPGDRP
jgi:hypothetical protein